MFDKFCLILFYVFRVIGYVFLITLWPILSFFMISEAFPSWSWLKCLGLDIVLFIALYGIIMLFYAILHGFEVYQSQLHNKNNK